MKSVYLIFLMIPFAIVLIGLKSFDKYWITEKHKGYSLQYTSIDKKNSKEYNKIVQN
jgi:hypothetical protein